METVNDKMVFTKQEFDNKLFATIGVSYGSGMVVSGVFLLFNKKVDKTIPFAIIGGGAIIISYCFFMSRIEKI
jgi:hypothetical protein